MSVASGTEVARPSPDMRHERGPFDIIGDVHGCVEELTALLAKLGYAAKLEGEGEGRHAVLAGPPARRAIFVGDFVDRGPNAPDVLRIVMAMVTSGQAMAVPGNHDVKFVRWLNGRNVTPSHGLDRTIAQFERESPRFREQVKAFLEGLPIYLWLDGGDLVVAHAGIKENMIGRTSGSVRSFCLYGDTDGEKDASGLAIRYHWAEHYHGKSAIVYGHTPVEDAEWVNNTLCIDTGCCFGGKLTALEWPEREIISVPAIATHAKRGREFGHPPARPEALRSPNKC
jgi:protein phosphatase